MLFFGVLSMFLLIASAEYCYKDSGLACKDHNGSLFTCNAKFGKFHELQYNIQAYAMANIETSFEYLLMSTYFSGYEANRDGFKGLYRKLSDKSWENAIDLIKYTAKRGGQMNFEQPPQFEQAVNSSKVFDLAELNSLARALDSEKQLATHALHIHHLAQHQHEKEDAAVAHYIEEHFLEPLTESVRQLAGYTNNLKDMLEVEEENNARSLSVFLFDEYLQKTM